MKFMFVFFLSSSNMHLSCFFTQNTSTVVNKWRTPSFLSLHLHQWATSYFGKSVLWFN